MKKRCTIIQKTTPSLGLGNYLYVMPLGNGDYRVFRVYPPLEDHWGVRLVLGDYYETIRSVRELEGALKNNLILEKEETLTISDLGVETFVLPFVKKFVGLAHLYRKSESDVVRMFDFLHEFYSGLMFEIEG